ncbi:hypothetical protein XNW1_2970001 [Xenorhabdus nematophila str. Websteri]|nr:hypothetical protein XNW1_2970001 [Xenorhabdus nematophila str. Websteri]
MILISSSILNKENVYTAIINSVTDTVNVIERIPHFLYNVHFRSPKSVEHYQVAIDYYDLEKNILYIRQHDLLTLTKNYYYLQNVCFSLNGWVIPPKYRSVHK